MLARDVAGTHHAIEIYNNLINPAIVSHAKEASVDKKEANVETGYKSSERAALENQLLQIETVARAVESYSDNQKPEPNSDSKAE